MMTLPKRWYDPERGALFLVAGDGSASIEQSRLRDDRVARQASELRVRIDAQQRAAFQAGVRILNPMSRPLAADQERERRSRARRSDWAGPSDMADATSYAAGNLTREILDEMMRNMKRGGGFF